MPTEFLRAFGVDVDAVAGWLGWMAATDTCLRADAREAGDLGPGVVHGPLLVRSDGVRALDIVDRDPPGKGSVSCQQRPEELGLGGVCQVLRDRAERRVFGAREPRHPDDREFVDGRPCVTSTSRKRATA